MKNLFFLVIVIFLITSNAFSQACFTPQQLLEPRIKHSDLIVVGTLSKPMTKPSTKSENNSIYERLEIVVERVIAGNIKTNEGLRLKQKDKLPIKDFYGSFSQKETEKGIFLLTLDVTGNIEFQCFYELTNLTEVKKLLKKYPKIQETTKILNIPNLENNISQPFLAEHTPENAFCTLSIEKSIKREYSPLQALLVILISIPLYYLLYRSNFKIR